MERSLGVEKKQKNVKKERKKEKEGQRRDYKKRGQDYTGGNLRMQKRGTRAQLPLACLNFYSLSCICLLLCFLVAFISHLSKGDAESVRGKDRINNTRNERKSKKQDSPPSLPRHCCSLSGLTCCSDPPLLISVRSCQKRLWHHHACRLPTLAGLHSTETGDI